MLERLRQAVIEDENVFAVLMDAVRVCSLGQITHALFEVGGQYAALARLVAQRIAAQAVVAADLERAGDVRVVGRVGR